MKALATLPLLLLFGFGGASAATHHVATVKPAAVHTPTPTPTHTPTPTPTATPAAAAATTPSYCGPGAYNAGYRAVYEYPNGTYWQAQIAAFPDYYAANDAYYRAQYGC